MVVGENVLYCPVVGNQVYMVLKVPKWVLVILRPLLNLFAGTVGPNLGPNLVWGNDCGMVVVEVPVGKCVGVGEGMDGRLVVELVVVMVVVNVGVVIQQSP